MPAKKKRREPDAQADLSAHTTAYVAALDWAAKAMDLRAAGKITQAQGAEKRARAFLKKAVEIEKRYAPITRERHMTKPHQ